MAGDSFLEKVLAAELDLVDIAYVRQYRAVADRKWRWDFAFPDARLLVEVQGGLWLPKSAHTWGAGLRRDYEKHNAAALAGWRTLYVTREMIEGGRAVALIVRALELAERENP